MIFPLIFWLILLKRIIFCQKQKLHQCQHYVRRINQYMSVFFGNFLSVTSNSLPVKTFSNLFTKLTSDNLKTIQYWNQYIKSICLSTHITVTARKLFAQILSHKVGSKMTKSFLYFICALVQNISVSVYIQNQKDKNILCDFILLMFSFLPKF